MTDDFQRYARFSIQIDQYYAAVRIYARYHDGLKAVHRAVTSLANWPKTLGDGSIPEPLPMLFTISAAVFNSMGTTGVFSEAPYPELKDLPVDMINFGFYTCFCFQWSLFETFVKESVLRLAEDGLLMKGIVAELRKRERSTSSFLKYIDDSHVFGNSPFSTVLPVEGWVPTTETCDYKDLDQIRKMRNSLMHSPRDPEILPNTEVEKEHISERSMWIMRKFAENIDHEVCAIRASTSAHQSREGDS